MRARFAIVLVTSVLLAGCTSSAQPTDEPSASSPAGLAPSVAPVASTVPSPSIAATESAEPSVAPSSPPSTTPLAWKEIARKAGGAIAGFSGGYVTLPDSGVDAKVLYSPDGASWKSVILPFPDSTDAHGDGFAAFTEAVASNGTQVIVVGGYSHAPCTTSKGLAGGGPPCASSPIAWVTSDGTHWKSSYPWPGPGPAKGFTQGNEFLSAWSIPGSGWDAASMDISGEAGSSGGVFHSADGMRWTKVTSPSPDHAGADRLELWHLGLADATGRQLIGGYWYPNGNSLLGLFTSADVKAWSPVTTFNGADTSVGSGVAPIDSLRPLWVIAGSDTNSLPTVWTSPDLVSWTAHELPTLPGAQGSVNTVAATHLGYVAVGQLSDGTDGSAYHSSWVSADGQSWTQIDTPSAPDGDGPDNLADGPGGVVGFAWYNGSTTPVGVWQLK